MSSPDVPTFTTRCRACYEMVEAKKVGPSLIIRVHLEAHSERRCTGSNTMQPMPAAPLAIVSAVSSTGAA